MSVTAGKVSGPVNVLGTNLNTLASDMEIPSSLTGPIMNLPSVGNYLENGNTPNIGLNELGTGDLPDVKLKEIGALQKASNVQEKIAGASEVGSKIEAYQEDLNNLQQGDIARLQEITKKEVI